MISKYTAAIYNTSQKYHDTLVGEHLKVCLKKNLMFFSFTDHYGRYQHET